MISEEITFPIYRKLFNGRSYYKIDSFFKMTELQIIGGNITMFDIVANQYPEQLLIKDILELDSKVYLDVSKVEYESMEQKKRET